MKIVKLKAENIKKLVAVEINPKGDVVKITGKNGAGKTSVLDSIYWALAGQDAIQSQPIRKGAKEGNISVDLGDMVVERKFTEKGSYLSIKNKKGLTFPTPQKMLDQLIGRMTFDPMEFLRQNDKQQFETLKELTGLDVSDLDEKRKALYEARTSKNREIASMTARYNAIQIKSDGPKEEVASGEIVTKIKEATAEIQKRDVLKQKVLRIQTAIEYRKQEIKKIEEESFQSVHDAEKQISQIRARLKEQQEARVASIEASNKQITAYQEELELSEKAIPDPESIPNLEALQNQLSSLEENNKSARSYQERRKLSKELEINKGASDALTHDIAKVDAEKIQKIAQAKFPLPDLGFGEGVVTYKELPLDQASEAEKLRVSMAMAMSMNPKLRVIRITDASLLDSESLKIIESLAKDNDFQVWLEMVDESGKVGIVIEDGQVSAVN